MHPTGTTAQERRNVARLAKEGLDKFDIAERLQLAVRTVEIILRYQESQQCK